VRIWPWSPVSPTPSRDGFSTCDALRKLSDLMTVAAVCCCRKIKKGQFLDRNWPVAWVELRGFEPLTPSMRTRCATGLRYSPEDLS
jgi:hypothetical protein